MEPALGDFGGGMKGKVWAMIGLVCGCALPASTTNEIIDTDAEAASSTSALSPNSNAVTATAGSSPMPSGAATPAPAETPAANPNDPVNPNTLYGIASRCADAGVKFCENWEGLAVGAQPDPNTWTLKMANSQHSMMVSDVRAARGKHALKVHVPNTFPMAALMYMNSVFPAPSNTLYGRVFVYFDAEVPGGHTTLITASGLDGSAQETVQFGSMFANYVANWTCPAPTADNGIYAKVPFPSKSWVCLEWAHKGDAGEMDVWADGVNIFTATNQWQKDGKVLAGPHPAYSKIGLGWAVYEHFGDDASLPAYDIYFDELALDYERIGCAR